VAIVTGAGTTPPGVGIGCAIAQVFAREGAAVLVVDKEPGNAGVTVEAIKSEGGQAEICQADVSSESDCQAMVAAAVSQFGRLDALINNAGITEHVPIVDTPLDLFQRVIAVNLQGTFMACKYAIPELIAGGGGSIVNIGSIVSLRDSGSSHPAYSASKGGVLGLTVDLAGEYGRQNVRVNAVLPGMIASPIQESVGSVPAEMQKRMNMLGRMGNVWDVAHATAFLCTDEASYLTAHVLPVDGGATQAMSTTATRADRKPVDRP